MRSWTVPGYIDVREFGRGGSGRTVLATHVATGTPVTIRYLADDLRRHEGYLAGYRAGARVVADIESPYVAGLYEYVESDDGVATVREYVDGGSVRQLMAASGLHPEAALSVLNAGLQALAAAHAAGATHGRYKPENLLVNLDGISKLADFTVVASATVEGRTTEQDDSDDLGADVMKDDISAALTTFLECMLGSRAAGRVDRRAMDRLPKQLRGLVSSAATGDGAAVVADLHASARATYGGDWEANARTRLARQASRLRRRG
jgi:serine/threonine protein kinase